MAQEVEKGKFVKSVTFEILRYQPDTHEKFRLDRFEIPVIKGMTVLDGLHYVKENLDSSLSWRYSCRMGVCGSCGMFINGLPRLACSLQILELKAKKIQIKPLPNFNIIKDLVPDLRDFFDKHRSIKPYLIRQDQSEVDQPSAEFFQSIEQLNHYIQFAYCIKCGLCYAACPTAATDDRYLGPQALAQVHRYNADPRDEGFSERAKTALRSYGPWRCHFAGACSQVCPKGVDPAMAIQRLKREIVLRKLHLKRPRKAAEVMPPPTGVERKPEIPYPPEPTVK